MAVEIAMPQLSDTMNEGKILTWLKKEGDQVKRGDALAEVATDKADLEIESFHDGVLLSIQAPVGTTVKVGSIIALIGDSGEKVSSSAAPKALPPNETASVSPPKTTDLPKQMPKSAPPMAETAPHVQAQVSTPSFTPGNLENSNDRTKISPLAKNLAASYGVDYSKLEGSGEGGRIVRRDIEKSAGRTLEVVEGGQKQAPSMTPQQSGANTRVVQGEVESLSKMRETIAERMVESARNIPHFYVTTKVCVDELMKLRSSLKPLTQYEGLTYNHLIVRAAALALRIVPRVNSSYHEGKLIQPQGINVGIVTAVNDGLLIPVVKNADQLSLIDTVAEARALVQRARSSRPKSGDLLGGTFSISNMGMFAVESFTAIISPGQGAILAVSSINDEPIIRNGVIEIGHVMRLTLSVDHRIIDGVVAGEFMTELKRLLEDPVLLLA